MRLPVVGDPRAAWSVYRTLRAKYRVRDIARILVDDVLFDLRKGTDTFAPVARDALFEPDRMELQNRYVPSTFALVHSSLAHAASLGAPLDRGFVDYGSGKGKVLVAAARFGFTRLKGIEYAESLHRIAMRNMERLGLGARTELVRGDAARWSPGPEDRVLYFFNPFMGDLLERCLERIVAESGEVERYLVYANPVEAERFARHFEPLGERTFQPGSVHVAFYRTRGVEPGAGAVPAGAAPAAP